MNSPNENPKQRDNTGASKEQTSCCTPACACHDTGGTGRMCRVLGVIVLVAAATLVGRAVVKNHGRALEPAEPVFMTLAPALAADSQSPASRDEAAETVEPSVGDRIASLSELNTVARANDAVFVYVPGKEGASSPAPLATLQSAADRIRSQGYQIALFTLRTGSRDHEQLAAQMSLPGVLAMVKGKGMSAVSGEITETKLIQGFVTAGSCGPGGCGPRGCCPAGSQ